MSHDFRFSISAGAPRTATEWRELARKAEDLGFSTLSVPDHLGSYMAPLIALTSAAEATQNLRIATLVLSNDFRHPAFLHKEAATLDLLSDGRLELGIGAGWQSSDYEKAGISMDRAGLRIERLAETITVVKGLFAEGPFDFSGQHYDVKNLIGEPKCIQKPHPPIIIAGGGQKILSLAAREADIVGLNANLYAGVIDKRAGPTATQSATDLKLDWIRKAADKRFEDIEIQTRVHVAAVTENPDGLADLMAPALGIGPEEALSSPHVLAGSVRQCIETLLSWQERWGISYIGISEDALDEFVPVVETLVDT